MTLRSSSLWAAALVAFSVATVRAQQSNLTYLDVSPCCIAQDGQGNSFIVSSTPLSGTESQPAAISVIKLDSSGNVVSEFPFMAGDDDQAAAAAVDPSGNLWIVGSVAASSQVSPVLGFIAKLDSTGTHVLFTGTFGGLDPSHGTVINAIAFDPAGNLYLAGGTTQLDFPVTPGAFIGAIPFAAAGASLSYGFVAKLTPADQTDPPYTVAYATLLGGQHVLVPPPCPTSGTCYPLLPSTSISALAVDSNGIVTVSGITSASDFPVTTGAFQTQFQGGDNSPDVFITRVNAHGTGLIWSTLLGQASSDLVPTPLGGIALDASGNVVLAGVTDDPNFPTTSGAIQPQLATTQGPSGSPGNGFLAKLSSTGASLLFSTFYGMDARSALPRLRLDAQGDIWMTEPLEIPAGVVLHPGSLGLGNALIAEIAADGSSVLFSELLPNGVGAQDFALNPDGSMTVAGSDFALRLPRSTPTGASILGVADSAAYTVSNTVAPGEYVSIYGTGLGPTAGVGMQIDSNGRVSNSLGGTQVAFDGVPAPLIYAAENQINVLVPFEIAGRAQTKMTVASSAGTSQVLPLQVVQAQPNIFAVLNADGSVNSSSNPAAAGSTISIFLSGAGTLQPALPDGTIATAPAPVPTAKVQVNFSWLVNQIFGYGIYGQTVTPSYAGGVPGMPIDMLRVDAEVPSVGCYTACTVSVQVGNAGSNGAGFNLAAPQN